MKISHLLPLSLLLFCFINVNAQEEVSARKYENPDWYYVVQIDIKQGKYARVRELIADFFIKADEMAGIPGPTMEIEMNTGNYDLLIIWQMQDGIENLNWDVSPNNVKWYNSLVELMGSEEEADALVEEYQSYVQDSRIEIGRKIN